ncbi:phospholipase A1-like isoform X2 [Contarinia nasturtii]|uniref:phospholipase A1-like isoform X2 n=1 Tax=Contarinia nasturtii TaxID=265458 RepID=UPI0012D39004|nr:phospholipase A1-like isoform X2 [Contarinia nasturtii]
MNWRIHLIILGFWLCSCSTMNPKKILEQLPSQESLVRLGKSAYRRIGDAWEGLDLKYVQTSIDVNLLNYEGDPMKFACVYNDSMNDFELVKSDDKAHLTYLVDKLNNGRGISLFFLGIGDDIHERDNRFKVTREWFIESGTNICFIAYTYQNYDISVLNTYSYLKKTLTTRRVEFVAREARDLILNVRKQCVESKKRGCLKDMSQVTMLGFSLGAHIAAYACRYLYSETNEKIPKLIGLDPGAVSYWIGTSNYIHRGDASYVQVIHTSYMGTRMQQGDHDVYVYCDRWHSPKNHLLALDLHELISAKKAILIASEKDGGRMINLRENPELKSKRVKLAEDECVVGVYNDGFSKKTNDAHPHPRMFELKLSFK